MIYHNSTYRFYYKYTINYCFFLYQAVHIKFYKRLSNKTACTNNNSITKYVIHTYFRTIESNPVFLLRIHGKTTASISMKLGILLDSKERH